MQVGLESSWVVRFIFKEYKEYIYKCSLYLYIIKLLVVGF